MRKIIFLTAIFCLLAISAFAQKTDFSGDWTLDVSKSKLDERARVESMTMNVAQTDKDIKIETATKRLPPPADAAQGGGGGQGGGMGRGGGKLKLSNSRTINTQMGEITITTKETWTLSDEGKTLTVKRDSETPRGINSSEMVFTKK